MTSINFNIKLDNRFAIQDPDQEKSDLLETVDSISNESASMRISVEHSNYSFS